MDDSEETMTSRNNRLRYVWTHADCGSTHKICTGLSWMKSKHWEGEVVMGSHFALFWLFWGRGTLICVLMVWFPFLCFLIFVFERKRKKNIKLCGKSLWINFFYNNKVGCVVRWGGYRTNWGWGKQDQNILYEVFFNLKSILKEWKHHVAREMSGTAIEYP